MIATLLSGLIEFFISVITMVLAPIDAIIMTAFPSLADMIAAVATIFTSLLAGVGWAISLSAIPPLAYVWLVGYWIFSLTVPFVFSSIKLIVQWWDSLVS